MGKIISNNGLEIGKMSKDRIREMLDNLSRPTPEQLAQLDKYGDFIQTPENPESSTTEQPMTSKPSTSSTKTEKTKAG